MKKILFLMMAMFACWQVNASEYSDINYIEKYGRLKLVGNQLSDANGKAVQLKGWSTFGLVWTSHCNNEAAFKRMKDWGANIVRVAMYVQEDGWASNYGHLETVKNMIDWSANQGIYCLVDWHVLRPGDPLSDSYMKVHGKDNAPAFFFEEIAKYVKNNNYIHVLYEICNEPNSDQSHGYTQITDDMNGWSRIKQYADKVLPAIQNGDPGAVVIVGTPRWDQLINLAAESPITGYSNLNIMYAFHVYAGDNAHMAYVSRMKTAARTIPIFMSEWGISNSDGGLNSTAVNTSNGDVVMQACDGGNEGGQKISWCFWSWSDAKQASASFTQCGTYDLAPSGEYITTKLCGDKDCSTELQTAGPYGGVAQSVPGVIDVGLYDLGGDQIAYFDIPFTTESTGEPTADEALNCNLQYAWNIKDNPDFNFRINGEDECVDAGNAGEYHKIGGIIEGEWTRYTINVRKPGYYSFKVHSGAHDAGAVAALSLDNKKLLNIDPNILYIKEGNNYVSADYFSSRLLKAGEYKNEWTDYNWTNPLDEDDNEQENYRILFKEAGEFVLKLTFLESENGQGSLDLEWAEDYTGDGYPDPDPTEVKDAAINTIYPIVSAEEISVNADVEKMEVINLVGAVLNSSSSNKINISNLASGTYLVRIYTADKNVVVKKFIKE